MRKGLLVVLMLVLASFAFAQMHYDVNPDGTLNYRWEAPANVIDGTIPAVQITYEFYIAFKTVADLGRETVANFELVDTVGPFTLAAEPFIDNVNHTVLGEGNIVAGVRAVRTVPDVPEGIFYTGMHWSDVGGVPSPFTVWYFIPLDNPTGIQLK